MANPTRLEKLLCTDGEWFCRKDDPYWTRDFGFLVEIGVCPIDMRTLEVRRDLAYGSLIRPPSMDQYDPYLTELTGITYDELASAPTAQEVSDEIIRRYGTLHPIVAYGEQDYRKYKERFALEGVTFPFGTTCFNFKAMLPMLQGTRKEVGMRKAINRYNLSFTGEQHRAKTDAENLGDLVAKVLKPIHGLGL